MLVPSPDECAVAVLSCKDIQRDTCDQPNLMSGREFTGFPVTQGDDALAQWDQAAGIKCGAWALPGIFPQPVDGADTLALHRKRPSVLLGFLAG